MTALIISRAMLVTTVTAWALALPPSPAWSVAHSWTSIPGYPGAYIDETSLQRIPPHASHDGGPISDVAVDMKVGEQVVHRVEFFCKYPNMTHGPDGLFEGRIKPLISSAMYTAAIRIVCN